jgi:restriction system protein
VARKNQSVFEDLLEITAHFPWWVGVVLAVVSYLFLHPIADIEIVAGGSPGQIGDMVGKQLYKTFATIGQYLLPAVFSIGAFASFVKKPKVSSRKSQSRTQPSWKPGPVTDTPVNRISAGHQQDKTPIVHESWSYSLITSLEWKRFEDLCAGLFSAKGYSAKTTGIGADGGVDVYLFKPGANKPLGIIQCKAWAKNKVGVKPIRELFGVMSAEQVPLGVFINSGDFTADARSFAKGKHIKLLTGKDLLGLINQLPQDKQTILLREMTKGDFTTPTCSSCGVKMKLRTNKRMTSKFWGCINFPQCRQTLKVTQN